MITKISSDSLNDKYVALFEEIADNSNNTVSFESDKSLEAYFGQIQQISALGTKYLRLPLDEPLFVIDANTRKITVPDDLKNITCQGDHIAETVYFEIDRYFDYKDLMTTDIYINWKIGNISGRSACFSRDAAAEPGKIIFGWALIKEITEKTGTLSFSVQFEEKNAANELIYNFNTLVASVNIRESLILDNPTVYDISDSITSLLSNSSFGSGEAAVNDVVWVNSEGLIKDLFDGEFSNEVNLQAYLDGDELKSTAINMYALANCGRDATIDYYDKNKVAVSASDIAFIEVPTGTELISNLTYYVSSGVDAYSVASSADREKWGTDDEVSLFVRAVKVNVNGVGSYFVNAQGIKKDADDNKIGASAVAACAIVTVPEAEAPSKVNISVSDFETPENYSIESGSKTIFIDGVQDMEITASAQLAKSEHGLLKFVLKKDGVVADTQNYSSSNEYIKSIEEPGTYVVEVSHYHNGGEPKVKASDSYIASYLASSLTAELEDNIAMITLNKSSSGSYVSGSTKTIKVDYVLSNEERSSEVKFELMTNPDSGDRVVVPATFAAVTGQDGVESCTISSSNIGEEGNFVIKVSNVFNGSVYSTFTDSFYINLNNA